jgi:predicted AAA+ superfamily ATPase
LIREDVAALENLQDLGRLELLMAALPKRVGSPLSINALREDLGVSHATVSRWLDVFERTYAIFRLAPFGAPKLRAVKKEQKHYHFDWTLVTNLGPRFENLVASHLLKWVHFQTDTEGRDLELRYFRDIDGREVDFVVVEERRPILAVECKLSAEPPGKGLAYFKNKFPKVEAWQIALEAHPHRRTPEGIQLAPATRLLDQWV